MQINIIEFDNRYAADFKRLNMEWLDRYGLTEPADIAMLDNYQASILDTGGVIYLAKAGDAIVGSAALIQENPGEFELAKMAVTAAFQGKGISKMLIEKCLDAGRRLGAKKIFLLSSTKLTRALSLYQQYGFRQVPVTISHYATADVKMELLIQPVDTQ
jgi:GNAT superfamily N-acetyltransferase